MTVDKVIHRHGLKKNLETLQDGQIAILEDQGMEQLVLGTVSGNVFVPNAKDFADFQAEVLSIIGDTNNLTTINKIIVNAINELNAKGGTGAGGGGSVNYTTWTYTATADNTTTFNIVNNGIYDPDKDYAQLYLHGVLLQNFVDYTISGLNVTLNTFALQNTESIYMLIFKVGQVSGTEIIDGTIQLTKLETSVQTAITNASKIGDLTTLETTAKDTVVNSINEIDTQLAEKANQSDLNTVNNNMSTITTKQSNNLGVYSWKNLFSDGFEYQELFKFKYKNGSDASAWTFSNGAISSGTNATDTTICLIKDKKFIDGRIDLVSSNPSTSSSWFGIVIGYKESTNTCMMVILRFGVLEVWTWDGTNFNHLSNYNGTLNDQDTTITTNTPVTLSVEKQGNYIICYVNDRYISAFEDNFVHTMANGMFGIIAENSMSHTFTNLTANLMDFSTINSSNISKIIFLGSSITNGVNQNTKYRDVACQNVQNTLTGKTVTGINGGVNGSTTSDMLTRLPSLISSNLDANICIIEGSVNDVKVTGSITSDITYSNMRNMIRICKQYNIIPVITTPTPIIYGFGAVGSAPDWTSQSWVQLCDMTVKIRQLAKEEGVRIIDNARRFGQYTLSQKESIMTDGVHPNDGGAATMAQDLLNTIIGKQIF